MKMHMNQFDKHINETIRTKNAQMDACNKLMNIMNQMIKTKDGTSSKPVFKRRRIGQDNDDGSQPTAIEELLDYLYKHYTELFVISGDTKQTMMLELPSVIKIIDDIPDELLERCTRPPESDKNDASVQTTMAMDPRDLSKTEVYTAFNSAYGNSSAGDKETTNNLLKGMMRYLANTKEKIGAFPEVSSAKLIHALLEDKVLADAECEKANKKYKMLPNFVLENLSMKFGLKTIAIKNMLSVRESLLQATKAYNNKNDKSRVPYSLILSSILGISEKYEKAYDIEEVTLIIRARTLWVEAQETFKKNLKQK